MQLTSARVGLGGRSWRAPRVRGIIARQLNRWQLNAALHPTTIALVREQTLRDFFAGQITAAELARDVHGSVERTTTPEGAIISRVRIRDMAEPFALEPRHLLQLLDAVEAGELDAEALDAICFCLEASDRFG